LIHSLSSAVIFIPIKMLVNIFVASSLFVTSALAAAEPVPYRIGSMSLNDAFGLLKRQAGYAPTQTYCGPGADCAASCGAGYVQCDSTDGDLHCYDPDIQQTCCPDGSGNSCNEGYFCTSDSTGDTWCCPDGLSLSACAASYTLTGSLVSETQTSTPGAAASTAALSSVLDTVTISTSTSSLAPSTSTTTTSIYTPKSNKTTHTTSEAVVHTTSFSNVTISKTASSTAVQVTITAGANPQAVFGGLPALLVAAGAILAF